jgi:hypothetical protein
MVQLFLSENITAKSIASFMVGHPSGTRMMFCFNTYCQYSSKYVLQRPTVDNAFKSKNGFKIWCTQISSGKLTHREEDKGDRGKDAAKGATVIFWRLGRGEEDELLAPRVLLLVFVAIFSEFREGRQKSGGRLSLAPEYISSNGQRWSTNRR